MASDALPGADERWRYQHLGEALLTDDGQITQARQAKTFAVEALAARMRSSTLELVLAATGLNVGSDMAGRLGDSRYVLVPHLDRDRSMGADLLHVDELSSEQYRLRAHGAVRMDTEDAEHLVRTIATSELLDAWSYGSSTTLG